jgi:TfoX/Sxy family transcriptional regulator of competence genes
VKLDKAPPELVERFADLVPDAPGVRRRPMFGYPSATVNGHMFMSLYADGLVLRLPEQDGRALGGEPFEPMPGRPMRGFVILRGAALDDADAVRAGVERALAEAAAMPPKPAKAPRARRAG